MQLKQDFELARDEMANPNAITGVHLKYAMFLEDEDCLTEAEDELLKAKKPNEISTLKKVIYNASLKFNSKKTETKKKEGRRKQRKLHY
eukprot:500352-Ditylum_brightwellii.AAC.1